MPGAGYFSFCPTGAASAVSGNALWNWDLSGLDPVVKSYRGNTPTKTGLLPNDLQQSAGVPLVHYNTNPPTPVPTTQLLTWLRDAEDWVEQETGLLLTPTWVASPPEIQPYAAQATGTSTALAGSGQVQGIDYDLADAVTISSSIGRRTTAGSCSLCGIGRSGTSTSRPRTSRRSRTWPAWFWCK
jgi:hypothetical protein